MYHRRGPNSKETKIGRRMLTIVGIYCITLQLNIAGKLVDKQKHFGLLA